MAEQVKHTPGPWRTDGYFSGEKDEQGLRGVMIRPPAPSGALIASAIASLVIRDQGEVDANARLIAAAPDIYKSLKAAVVLIQCNVHPSKVGEEYNDMLAAIAKAEGGAK